MKIYDFDVIIIGSGCAGYNCADWLHSLGKTNIAIVTEAKNAGTSRNTGSDKQTYYKLSLAGDEGDSVGQMAQTLFDGGAMDGDIAMCEAAGSAKCFYKLVNLGVRFPVNRYGEFVGYKTDHDPYRRATSIGPYTSKKMTEVLEEAVMSRGIALLDRLQAIKILVDDGRVTGLLCLDRSATDHMELVAIRTPHVVIATGGPAAIYKDSVYPVAHTGNSSLALEAGADMCNLSEWQYGLASTDFRWNVSGTYQQVLPRYISIDENGIEREFLTDYFTDKKEMLKSVFLKGYEWPFDVRKIHGSSYVDLIVYHESVVLGRKVYMDFTREPSGLEDGFESLDEVTYAYLKNSDALIATPIARLEKMNRGAIELYREHGIDITREPLRVAVCAQHNNGGIRVDTNWQTNIKGLYAAGEVAGTLGIFRPGGSALNSTQVGSMRAAEHIVYQSDNTVSDKFNEILNTAKTNIEKLIEATRADTSTLSAAREKYCSRMSRYFAFLRNIPSMSDAIAQIKLDIASFDQDNKWAKYTELPRLFKNLDILLMQNVVAQSMLHTAKKFGSRGSAYVLTGDDFMARSPIAENTDGRKTIIVSRANDKNRSDINIREVPVHPIPHRDLWFERVWNEYRQITGD
jgi:succinate dehydrogenase/fumarate reductase flavoprotein subunit